MSDFSDIFKNMPSREEMRQEGQAVRMQYDDGERPEAGKYYSVSPCFRHGDRSWCDDLWFVREICGPNALVEIEGTYRRQTTRFVPIDERAWYSVSEEGAASFLSHREANDDTHPH